jgi:DNA-binding transcriptional LysR family regulator
MGFQRRHLEVLVAIADCGSIHKAAASLGLAQPAVSRVVGEVERDLGARLFERAASGSSLTRKGDAVVAHARHLLHGLQRLDELARSHPSAVRFGCIPRAMHTLMPHVLELMRPGGPDALPPACRLQVVEEGSTVLLDALQRARLDMAVMRHVGGADGISPALHVDRLYEERPLVVAAPGHPLAARRQVPMAALLGQRWVLPAAETTTRAVLDRFYLEQGLAAIDPVLETRSFESCAALAAESDLLSLIPESIARRHERAGLVCVLPVVPALPGTAVLLVCERQTVADPVLGALRQVVQAAAARARERLSLRP